MAQPHDVGPSATARVYNVHVKPLVSLLLTPIAVRWDLNEFGLSAKLVYKTAYDATAQNLVNNPSMHL